MIPMVLMLVAAAITSIISFCYHFSLKRTLIVLVVVLIVFYSLGALLRYFLLRFSEQNEKAALDEGEVIEKDAEPSSSEETGIS